MLLTIGKFGFGPGHHGVDIAQSFHHFGRYVGKDVAYIRDVFHDSCGRAQCLIKLPDSCQMEVVDARQCQRGEYLFFAHFGGLGFIGMVIASLRRLGRSLHWYQVCS